MKQKKLYAIKEQNGLLWKTEININDINQIIHKWAGCGMDTDELIIELLDGTNITVDRIIAE